jgi:uncharacterized membrane protein
MARKSNRVSGPPKAPVLERAKPAANTALWAARVFIAAAAAISAWMLWYAIVKKPMAGCGPGSPCDRVMGSAWAYWLNIPVSAPALAAYLSLLGCTFAVASPRAETARNGWMAGFFLSALAVGSAAWFTYLQLGVIHSICKYCSATHLLGVIGAGLFLAKAPRPGALRVGRLALPGLLALLAFGGLVAGQKFAPRKINVTGTTETAKFKFDLREAPIIGSPQNKAYVVSLFDYTCPDCHEMHAHLLAARAKFNNSFSIISMPVPLDAACNPRVRQTPPKHAGACDYARLGLAMRRCGAELYQKYDDWFFSRGGIPPYASARAQAESLAGAAALEKALADPWVGQVIQEGVRIYERNGAALRAYRLPQLIVGNRVHMGPVRDLVELTALLQRDLPAEAVGLR